ncbi:MAG: branched-chain amino acid ABC transporter permease, partial [Proteobacteria bacterium]|nr:branched-chain amino acid ABC transporter permease [Pseudomonadota bacterium]
GVIPFTFLSDQISANFPNQTTLLFGVAFLLIVYAIPNGVVGLVENLLQGRKWRSG